MSGSSASSKAEAISVVVRCRPFIKNEAKECKDMVRINSKEGVIRVGDRTKKDFDPNNISTWREFTYDTVYDKNGSQEEVFDRSVKPILEKVLKGFNSTIFCYGQTSSGKTFTMMGDLSSPKAYGIVPKVTEGLFEHIGSAEGKHYNFTIMLSFLEIYNEKVFDLLVSGRRDLKIRQTKARGFHVPSLSHHVVSDAKHMFSLINAGFKNRSTSATSQNAESSRSHSMLTVRLEKAPKPDGPKANEGKVQAKLNLVDLAGSERYHSGSEQQAKESTSINQSLSTLANVISALAQNKKSFIPYRDSSLTKLLKDALGGSASTLMFGNVNPCDRNASETVSTLRYASRAKKIKNKPKVQIYLDPKSKQIRQMQDEILRLRQQLASRDRVIEGLKEGFFGSGERERRESGVSFKQPVTPIERGMSTTVQHDFKETKSAAAPKLEASSPRLEIETLEETPPEVHYLQERNNELLDELNETRQREQELDQEIEALTTDVHKLEVHEVELEDQIIFLKSQVEQAAHRETHLTSQLETFKRSINNKFKEKAAERKVVEFYKREAEMAKKESDDALRMMEDFKSFNKHLNETLERERQQRVDATKTASVLKKERDDLELKYQEETERVEDLCLQLVECRNALEAERKAAEAAEEAKSKSEKKRARRPSIAIRFTKETREGFSGLVSPSVSPRGSPRQSMNDSVAMSVTSRTQWSMPRRIKKQGSFVIADLPRSFRSSFILRSDDVKEKSLTPFQNQWGSCLAQYLNIVLETETDLVVAGLIPVKLHQYTTVQQMSHPLLIARFLNFLARSRLTTYIDETKIKQRMKNRSPPTMKEKRDDMNMVLGAIKAAGIDIGKVTALQIVERDPPDTPQHKRKSSKNPLIFTTKFDANAVFGLVHRLIEYHLGQRLSIKQNPNLEKMGSFKGWGISEMTSEQLRKLTQKELVLRWVNLNLFEAVSDFEERGQNLEAVLDATGIKIPLIDFKDDWGVMVPVLVIAGLMGRTGNSGYAVSFAAQVMVEEDYHSQLEMIDEQMRARGGQRALCFFAGDVSLDDLNSKERALLCEKLNVLFSMAVMTECTGYDPIPDHMVDSDDEFDIQYDNQSAVGVGSVNYDSQTLGQYD
ncbi:hypothetical protein AAMO2058_000698300 [Amorphochlora amoebiformis]